MKTTPCFKFLIIPVSKVTLPQGMVLAGWGKAKFREGKKDAPVTEDETLFHVDTNSQGYLDGTHGSMQDFLDSARLSKPDAKICYHKCTKQPDGDWLIAKETGGSCHHHHI